MGKKAPTWFSVTTVVMAWLVFSAVIISLFVTDYDQESREAYAANFSGAAVSIEVNKAVANAALPTQKTGTPTSLSTDVGAVHETVKEDSVVVVGQDGSEMNPYEKTGGGYVKVLLGRGQNLSYVAWKYTGDANNWKAIAMASNLKTDDQSQRKIFVGTVVWIPQSIMKKELLPAPSAEEYRQSVSDVIVMAHNFQEQWADANWWLWYWVVVSGALAVAFVLALAGYLRERNEHDLWYGQMEHFRQQAALLPGNFMDFKTREGKTLQAMITKVELVGGDGHLGEPVVTEVECLAPMPMPISDDTAKCGTRVNPKNFLSHYFQQHPVAEPAKESC